MSIIKMVYFHIPVELTFVIFRFLVFQLRGVWAGCGRDEYYRWQHLIFLKGLGINISPFIRRKHLPNVEKYIEKD